MTAVRAGDRRVGFADGGLLAAADLADDRAHEARLRGLHTGVVHGTWGISLGLELRTVGTTLVVSPGLAHDCRGRELVLSEGVVHSMPEGDEGEALVLVVHHDEGPWRPPLDVAAVRLGAGPDSRRDRPAFGWRRLDDVAWGEEVPLGTVTREDEGLGIDTAVRVYVRALERPHIGFGTVTCTRGPVPRWTTADGRTVALWACGVTTDEGGFVETPDYVVVPSPQWTDGLPAGLEGTTQWVEGATATGFTFGLAAVFTTSSALGGEQLQAKPFDVTWFGLEDRRGCPPPLWNWLFAAFGIDIDIHLGGIV